MVQFLLNSESWEIRAWNVNECTIVELAGGGYGVMDSSIQTLVAKGDTEEEVREWLGETPALGNWWEENEEPEEYDYKIMI